MKNLLILIFLALFAVGLSHPLVASGKHDTDGKHKKHKKHAKHDKDGEHKKHKKHKYSSCMSASPSPGHHGDKCLKKKKGHNYGHKKHDHDKKHKS